MTDETIYVDPPVIGHIAKVCHEANRAFCQTLGDYTQIEWEGCPQWQRESAVKGVIFHFDNPDAGTDDSHNSWLQVKQKEGWKYGPVKDAEKKEHPCFLPYAQLPFEQKLKDYIFRAICHGFKDAFDDEFARVAKLNEENASDGT